jgi:hypothetical protein
LAVDGQLIILTIERKNTMSVEHGELVQSYKDFDNEVGTVTFPGTILTAANFAAQLTLMGDLTSKVALLTGGTLIKTERKNVIITDAVKPTDAMFQREAAWLCRYKNVDTGQILHLSLPCMDPAEAATVPEGWRGGTYVDIVSAGNGLDFKTAFEAYVKVYDAGGVHAVTLLEIVHVGRRN